MKRDASNRTNRCEVCDETPMTSSRWPICKACVRSYNGSSLSDNSYAEAMTWAARRARLFERRRQKAKS